jgi:anti-sigma B factor antagonist
MCHMGPSPAFAVQVLDLESLHPIVRIQGEIDVATAPEMADSVATVLAHDPLDLVLDLTDTEFMDCSGVGVIVRARNHLPDESRVILRHPTPIIRQVFALLELDTAVVIEA